MEPLVFALAALRKGYIQKETHVPEPTEFLPFDLRALKCSYEAKADPSSGPSDRENSLVTQTAS
jgi:hypothetical protein